MADDGRDQVFQAVEQEMNPLRATLELCALILAATIGLAALVAVATAVDLVLAEPAIHQHT